VTRDHLRHLILEIGTRFDLDYFYIIGAASILASIEAPDPQLTLTRDVDVIPNVEPDSRVRAMADQIDRVIGEGSEFDEEHGYYAQGVDFATPTFAPRGWRARCVPVRVKEFTALCMEPHDLVISKLGAGREKDLEFARVAARCEVIQQSTMNERLTLVDADAARHRIIQSRADALYTRA